MRASLLLAGLIALGLVTVATRAEAAPPPHWLCPATWYGTLDGCDVGCGNYDVDCDTQNNLYNGCPSAYPGLTYDARTATTDPKGDYTCGQKSVGVPDGWSASCGNTWYDADDGCDCGCGEIDPDCADNGDTFYCWGGGSGTSCSATATCQTVASSSPAATYTLLHFGGMGSNHFDETSSSKLNNTIYKVRLANTTWTSVDAWVDMKTVANIQATYATVVSYLDSYCSAGKTCGIYTYSAGTAAFAYAYNTTSNRATRWPGFAWHVATGAADCGSDLAAWGRLAEMVTSPMASTLTKTNMRAIAMGDKNIPGNAGISTYRNAGKGHSAWAPWGWSSSILWAASAFISNQDDGAVGVEGAAGCTSSAGRSDMNCTRYTGFVCNGSCTPQNLDHYEMKVQGLIANGW